MGAYDSGQGRTMGFASVRWDGIDWSTVRRLTLVPYGEDVEGWVLTIAGDRLVLPSGDVAIGEDPRLDTVLRIGLEIAGFRRQEFYPLGIDGEHLAVWSGGGRYHGTAPHAQVQWWYGPADEAAALLTAQGDHEASELVVRADERRRNLDDAEVYDQTLRLIEHSYLRGSNPRAGSGFGGDAADWRAARSTICDAIEADGTFLDVGCVNGHLMESVAAWTKEKGMVVEPYGMDLSARLVAEARRRLPYWRDRIWVGNAIGWIPPGGRRFDVVHTLADCVPEHAVRALLAHLLDHVVADGGRLLVSSYVDISAGRLHAAAIVRQHGYDVAGETRTAVRPDGRTQAPSAWIDRR